MSSDECNYVVFFNDTATTEIYTLSLHDALPIFGIYAASSTESVALDKINTVALTRVVTQPEAYRTGSEDVQDRKSTRLNSSHANISYAVFCLKKKHREVLCAPHPHSMYI